MFRASIDQGAHFSVQSDKSQSPTDNERFIMSFENDCGRFIEKNMHSKLR